VGYNAGKSVESQRRLEGDMLLRNVRWLLTDYMAVYPRRQNSSLPYLLSDISLEHQFYLSC
jgi:hypothetical protein